MGRKFIFGGSFTSFEFLLSKYPSAQIGFSLRKLRSDYNGNCIRVRRSSDNATLDIGFINNQLDTASLLSFVGAASGYVAIWYNQASSNNATQTIAVNQPRIVNSGVLETKNGKPSLLFSGNQVLELSVDSGLRINGELYSFAVASTVISQGLKTLTSIAYLASGAGRYAILNDGNSVYGFVVTTNGDSFSTNIVFNTNLKIFVHSYTRNAFNKIKVNTVENSLAVAGLEFPPTHTNVTFKIGAYTQGDLVTPTFFWDGHIQEVVNYYNDQSSNKISIETNINDYYGIY